jgi:hypothetical protein
MGSIVVESSREIPCIITKIYFGRGGATLTLLRIITDFIAEIFSLSKIFEKKFRILYRKS